MKVRELHRWGVTPEEARRIQEALRGRVELQDRFATGTQRHREKKENRKEKIEKRPTTKNAHAIADTGEASSARSPRSAAADSEQADRASAKAIRTVAGADVAFAFRGKGTSQGRAFAGVIVYSFPELREIERAWAERPLEFPYVPGLLSFRELPALLAAMSKLRAEPDVIFCDAQGYAHPRRFGLACHLGVLLDRATVGCAKSRLIGEHKQPRRAAGSWAALKDAGETVGAVLRTRTDVKPLYVSPGHRVSLRSAIELVLAVCDGYRIPKPTREADYFVEQLKRRRKSQTGTVC